MKIEWEVEDGYCGGSRPQSTEVPDDELQECSSREEQELLVTEYIDHDFVQRISFFVKNFDEMPKPEGE